MLPRAKKQKSPPRSEAIPDRATELRLVVVVGLLAAAITAIAICWEHASASPERVVTVYRLHGCRCAFSWANALEKQGFVVRMYEYETLEYVRGALHVPASLSSCHVGKYLDYFVEGHVSASVLLELARTHPQGLGVAVANPATQATTESRTAVQDRVLLVELDGHTLPWSPPPNKSKRAP